MVNRFAVSSRRLTATTTSSLFAIASLLSSFYLWAANPRTLGTNLVATATDRDLLAAEPGEGTDSGDILPSTVDLAPPPAADYNEGETSRPGIFQPFKKESPSNQDIQGDNPEEAGQPPIGEEGKDFEIVPPTLPRRFGLYRLGPGDSISVIFRLYDELNFQGTLNLQGNIIVPLMGVVSLEGLTLEEAREKIRIGLDRYVVEPEPQISLLAQRPVNVTIAGEVFRPGIYPLGSPRVSSALLSAGGTTRDADLREIRILRTLIDGSSLERTVDLFTPLVEGQALPDEQLQDGDAIVVAKREFGVKDGYDANLISRSTLAQPTIRIRVLSYAGGGFGTVTLPNGSTFADAMNGVPLQTANLKNVALVRFDQDSGKAVTRKLNAKKAFLGDVSHNVPLRDNDVIIIGRNFITRVTSFFNSFTQPFRDTLGFLLFFRELENSADSLFGPTGGNNNNN